MIFPETLVSWPDAAFPLSVLTVTAKGPGSGTRACISVAKETTSLVTGRGSICLTVSASCRVTPLTLQEDEEEEEEEAGGDKRGGGEQGTGRETEIKR